MGTQNGGRGNWGATFGVCMPTAKLGHEVFGQGFGLGLRRAGMKLKWSRKERPMGSNMEGKSRR